MSDSVNCSRVLSPSALTLVEALPLATPGKLLCLLDDGTVSGDNLCSLDGDAHQPLIVQTVDWDTPATRIGPWAVHANIYANTEEGAGTYNHAVFSGWNVGRHSDAPIVANEHAWYTGIERNYYDPADHSWGPEWYLEYYNKAGAEKLRPIFVRVHGSEATDRRSATVTIDTGHDGTGIFALHDGNTDPPIYLAAGRMTFGRPCKFLSPQCAVGPDEPLTWTGYGIVTVSGATGGMLVLGQTPIASTQSYLYSNANGLVIGVIQNKPLDLRTNNTTRIRVPAGGVQAYADNAAALAGGLTACDLYRIGDTLAIVH